MIIDKTEQSNRTSGEVSRRTFLGAVGAAALAMAGPEFVLADAASPSLVAEIPFSDGWMIQSSTTMTESGFVLSQAGYAGANWTNVSVPTTVLAGLVADGQYPDLFHGDNLKQIRKSLFRVPWWYRKNFKLVPTTGQQIWLHFKGINYRANIWLNGQQIGSTDQIAGAYRDIELNVTSAIDANGNNALAVEIFPPAKTDLSITFVDWAPAPPDQNMGIWQDVTLRTTGPVALSNPHVIAEPELPDLRSATLTFMVDLNNTSDQPMSGFLTGFSEGLRFDIPVGLDAREKRTIAFEPIVVRNPRIWWPWQLGSPELYHLTFQFNIGNQVSDRCFGRYGIRNVSSRLKDGHLLFTVNGVDLLIVGGGYAPDLLQRRIMPDRPSWQEDHLRYVRDMNLNTIRLEGKLEDDAFFDLCDEHGILVMAGWCCCSAWEKWKDWDEEQHLIARESLKYQIRKLRTHPCMLAWLNGSDNPPPSEVETAYLAIEANLKWPCPIISSASAAETSVTGVSGVKMEGPYKWEPPIFWTTDTKTGGAWGFNTEVGPGAVPPPLETLEKILPPNHRWPIDSIWQFHCGGGSFAKLDSFNDPLDARYGKSTGIADYAWKSQAQAYETIRAMYEGFRANKWNATGEIQWMLNNAWPSMIWHLYDYYWRPGGAYFATKLACEPLHILYRYDNQAIVIANDTLSDLKGAVASADIYELGG
ncbi:MAG TPA: hypothetical protein VL992_17355, partial [Tepidisphaeraceae bacterium]|nr:hypothetical protein [Tepidisphaeraceae bacterium]